MAQAKRLREVGGQLVFDQPWLCSMCGRDYHGRRVHRLRIWVKRATRGSVTFEAHQIRLCVSDELVQGCWEMGLSQLFRHARGKSE